MRSVYFLKLLLFNLQLFLFFFQLLLQPSCYQNIAMKTQYNFSTDFILFFFQNSAVGTYATDHLFSFSSFGHTDFHYAFLRTLIFTQEWNKPDNYFSVFLQCFCKFYINYSLKDFMMLSVQSTNNSSLAVYLNLHLFYFNCILL